MASVEMRQAFEWTCEECGRNQFASAIACELSEDEKDELRERFDADEEALQTGNLVAMPEHVTCECGATFETLPFGEDDESAE